MEAGTSLQIIIPVYLCYGEPLLLHQQAGTGDAIFAPYL